MKKIQVIFIAVISLCLCACTTVKADKDTANLNSNYNSKDIVEKEEPIETEFVSADNKNKQAAAAAEMEISNKAVTIPYHGDELYIRSIVNAEDIIYLSGLEPDSGNYVIHKMKIEDGTSEKLPIDIPEKMIIQGINTDKDGNLHIFFTNTDRSLKRCEMWVSDKEGNIIRTIDMKKAFTEQGAALIEFVIDGEGRYYISGTRVQDPSKSGIIVLDAEGNLLGLVDSPNSNLWGLQSIARGKDGKVYAVNFSNNQEMAVMSIDPEALCIKDFYEGVLPSGSGRFLRVRAGIDADLYLYGAAGIYSYDLGDESGKQLADSSTFTFPTEAELCHEFLADGRFLLVGGDHLGSGELYKNIVFYYLPVTLSGEEGEE